MSKKLPKAVRIALANEGFADETINAVDEEMTHEYEHAIARIRNISDRIEDAMAFLSFSSDGIPCEASWHNQQGLCEGY